MQSVKISARNQVALPKDMLDRIGAHTGERLVVRLQDGALILIPERMAEAMLDQGMADFQKAGRKAFEAAWDNDEDEAWNEA